MKVKVYSLSEKARQETNGRNTMCIEIDGKNVFYASDGEPEDNNLARNFEDCFKISEIIQLAFEEGVEDCKADEFCKGEGLEIEKIEVDNPDL